MDLDELLDAANPTATRRDAPLLQDLGALVQETRASRRRQRWTIRWGVAGIAVLAVLGVGSTALASGHLPFDWTSKQGGKCQIISATVEIAGLANDNEAAFKATTPAQRQQALMEARRYLAEYNYKAIDIKAAIATWQKAEAAAIAAQPDPAERAPKLTGDDLEYQALIYRAELDLEAHLKGLGLHPEVLTPVFGYTGQAGPDGVFRCDG